MVTEELNCRDSQLTVCCLSPQVVHVWTETRRRERECAVQAEGGGGEAGGGSEAADTNEWHQSEQLHHKDSAKQ